MVLNLLAAGSVAAVISGSLTSVPDENTGQVPFTAEALAEPFSVPALASPDEQAALAEAVTTAVNDAVPGTQIGLAVYDQLTEETLTSVNADQQFYTASVVKLLIAIQVLRDAGWKVPTGSEREGLVAMLSRSADGVASTLWRAHGGPAITGEVTALAGLADTIPPRNPDQWESTRMSPRDVLSVYKYIDNELPPDAREFVLTALADATDPAADGFDQFFGIPDALPDTEWATKQGWMRITDGLVLNTTGIVGSDRRYVVALLTRHPGGIGFGDARAAVTAGIAALAPTLTAGAHQDCGTA